MAEHVTLQLVATRPDLPPLWDGVRVEWVGWTAPQTTMILHAPPDDCCCRKCGTIGESLINWGIRPPDKPTYPGTRIKTTKSGHQYEVAADLPSWPVRDLIAARCKHCRHDVVTDTRTDEVWDLDESDYAPEGSYPADVLF